MEQVISRTRRATALAVWMGVATMSGMALAQDAPDGDSGEAEREASRPRALEEIVVTAQRREESLQDVPISALVMTGDNLASKGVEGLYGLQYAAPSLTVSGMGSANVLNIRGIGRSAVDIELPSAVVIYRDGFPTFPGFFQNEPYFDLAAVEVLRGPQGTFVGKSAAGGAIFIRTASPDLTGFSGKLEAEAGNFEQFGARLMLNAPINDRFGVRLAYYHQQRNDVLVDSLSGPFTGRPGRPELHSLRLGALWHATERLSVEGRVDLSDLDFGGNLTSSFGTPLFDLVQDADFAYRDRTVRAVSNIRYSFDNDLVLSSVTGYQRALTTNNLDRNGNDTRVDRFDSRGAFDLYSQEFNLISPIDAGRFAYVLGIFLQRTDQEIPDWRSKGFNLTGEEGDLGGLVQGSDYPYLGLDTPYTKREDEFSVFADFRYDLTERLELQLGLRYSHYRLEDDVNVVLGDGVSPPSIPFVADARKFDQNDLNGKLAASWKINDANNVYALVARGHVVGGFNIIDGGFFQRMIVYSYEAGWKGSAADGRLRMQAGPYYQRFSKYQAQFASEDVPGTNILQNADGTSEVYGFEASMQARLDRFTLDAALALTESKLGDFPRVVSPFLEPPDNVISISGGETPFTPDFSLNVGASYRFSLGAGVDLTPRLDVGSVSSQSGALFVAPQTRIAGRTLLNGGVRLDRGDWYADFNMTNITDKRYVAGIQNLGVLWYPGEPRRYQLRVGRAF